MLHQVGKWIRGITQDLRDFTDYSDSPSGTKGCGGT